MTIFSTAIKYSLIVILYIILFFDKGFAQTWVPKNTGQYSGSITTMIFFNDTLYAGTESDGIYASSNRGQTWKQSDQGLPEEANVSSFAIRNDTLFAGLFSGGLFVKTISSSQWKAIAQPGLQDQQITSLLFLSNKLFAGTVNGVYVSSNRNAPWQAPNNGFQTPPPNTNPDTWITALCPAGNTIMASDDYRGTYLLQSNGTWMVDTTGMNPNMHVTALENIQGEIYCGTSGNNIYLSEDNGTTWLSIGAGLSASDGVMSISFFQTKLLVGTLRGKLLSSANKGATWTTVFSAPSYITKILVDGTDIFIGTYQDGVYKSSDGGATWAPANNGLINAPISNLENFNGSLYATANENFYRSDNSGRTWSSINQSIGYYRQFNFALLGDSLIALTNYGVSFSMDKGITWQPLTSDGRGGTDYFTSLYSYRGRLFAGSSLGIYQFDKLNNIWHALNQFPTNPFINCFLERGDSLLAGGLSDVFLSLDHGASWAPLNVNTPTNFNTLNLINVRSKLFASSNSGLFLSNDNGKSWINATPSNWGSVNTLFNYKGYIFAGLYYNGIFFSSDGGDTWKSAQKGFLFPPTVNSFTALNDTIYAGTTEGVWACPLKSFGPTISSFTPQSGPPGTAVTIYGSNFDSEIPYDSVYFNGSVAKIIVASDNGLSVVVPSKAKTGPISITITGQAATSTNSFVVTAPGSPLAPIATAATGPSSSGFTANWNAVTGATGYQLDISADNFNTFVTGYNSKSESGTSDVVTGLVAGTTYQFQVRAINASGPSGNSNVIIVTTSGTAPVPVAPVATTPTAISANGFTANWNNVAGAMGYQLDISTDNFNTFITGYNSKSEIGTSDVVIGLAAGTSYQYRARATNAAGASGNSNVVALTPSASGLSAQTILFPAIANVTVGGPTFTLGATSSSGLTITYLLSSKKVTLNGNVVTIVSAGRDTITATQPGNANFKAAAPVSQSFCITPAQPTISLSNNNTATPTLTSSASSGNQWFLNGTAISGATASTLNVTAAGTYTVQTTTTDGCASAVSASFPIIVTEDIPLPQSLSLYPNPSKDFVHVTGIQEQVTNSSVIDMMGRSSTLKLDQQGDVLSGDIQNLTTGMYILKIMSGTSITLIKFIKQ